MANLRKLTSIALLFIATIQAALAQYSAVTVTGDGRIVAAGGSKGHVGVWNTKDGSYRKQFPVSKAVRGLAFVGDERLLAVGTYQGGLTIWMLTPRAYICKERLLPNEMVDAVAVSPNGKTLAASCFSGWTYLFETSEWKQVGVIFEKSNFTCSVKFSADGLRLFTAGNTWSAWNLRSDSPIWAARGERSLTELDAASHAGLLWSHPSGGDANVDAYCADIAVSQDGKMVVGVSGVGRHDSGGKRLKAFDAASGRLLWEARSVGLTTVALSNDGTTVITGGDDGKVRLWNASTGEMIQEIQAHSKPIRDIVPIPASSQFITTSEDSTLATWDAQTGKLIRRLRGLG